MFYANNLKLALLLHARLNPYLFLIFKRVQEEEGLIWDVVKVSKGPSIKDVSSEEEEGGYEKLQIGETFKA